jgi:hypothetical protein
MMQDFRRDKFLYVITCLLISALPLVLLPEPVWVLVQQEEGELLLKQGKQDYMEGRFEEAVEKLTLAIKLLTGKDKLVDAYLHLALSHFALGEKDKTKENLAELLKLDVTKRLDPLYYPPDFINLLEEAKKGIIAQLEVESDPPVAQVFLDGELVGLTPVDLPELAAGEHKLKIIKQGYKLWEKIILLDVGEKKIVSTQLEKEEGKPTVAVTPAEKKPEVKKGRGWLWILLGGAAAAIVAILAMRGGKEKVTPTTTPTQAFGSIQVKSYPNGASIFLDGQNTGFKTNHTLTNIPTGRHTILLRLAGWKDWEEEVTVNQNQTAVVKPCLLPPNGCFRDNFQDGDTDGWDLKSGWKIKKQGGNYFIEGKSSSNETHLAYTNIVYRKDFILKFRLKLVSLTGGYVGASFRDVEDNLYLIFFSRYKTYCYKWREWRQLGQAGGISIGNWHNIELRVSGDNFQLFVDDLLRLNVNHHDERLMRGSINFLVWNGSHAQVDDIVITSDECP